MLLKRYLVFRRCASFKNNFVLIEKAILFKRGGLLSSCYWCNSRDLCKEIVLKHEIGIGLRSMESFCINLDDKFMLDDHKYTLYAIQEVSNSN